ncbi:MAG: hypothetical protein V3T23_11125 [Nitrososphaerales archaeon]
MTFWLTIGAFITVSVVPMIYALLLLDSHLAVRGFVRWRRKAAGQAVFQEL